MARSGIFAALTPAAQAGGRKSRSRRSRPGKPGRPGRPSRSRTRG